MLIAPEKILMSGLPMFHDSATRRTNNVFPQPATERHRDGAAILAFPRLRTPLQFIRGLHSNVYLHCIIFGLADQLVKLINYSCSVAQGSTLLEPGYPGCSCDIIWHKSMHPGCSCNSFGMIWHYQSISDTGPRVWAGPPRP